MKFISSKKLKAKIPNVDRVGLQWLLATGIAACALLAFELPPWVAPLFAAAAAWRYAMERWHVFRPNRWLGYALLALMLFVVYDQFGTILGRDPGATLLVTLLGLKLLELRTQRDAILTLLLFYVVIASAFLFNQTLITGLWAVVTVGISIIALMRVQQTLPTRVALRLTGELLLKAVPLLLILYVLFPRVGGALWQLPSDAYGARTGMSSEMRPGSVRSVSQSDEIAFRVDFLGARPSTPQLYWRGLVLWRSDGITWTRAAPLAGNETITPLDSPVRYRVTLEPSNETWLYALDLPVAATPNARRLSGTTFVSDQPIHERSTFLFTSHTRYVTGPLSIPERVAALALPPVSARVREFVETMQAQSGGDPAALARAVLMHFRNENFVYTLTPPLLGDDPVDEFLFDTRRGFCEHYASAFATLMRVAGIPSRVVLGYQGGEFNPSGNYLIVRQYDAHAWVEIWLAGRGWTRVDPTAAVAPERIELGFDAVRRLEAQGLAAGAMSSDLLAKALRQPWFQQALRSVRLYWDYTNVAWHRWVIDYQQRRQESFLRALGFESIDWPRILGILGGACTLVMLAYVIWSRRAPRPDPAQRIYLRFCRKLARVGLVRASHEGPAAYCKRAGSARPDLAPDIVAITGSYLDLRYAQDAGNDEMKTLARAVASFKVRRE